MVSVIEFVLGFLVDKFGHYKPVVLFSLILNLVFHHALMLIPQMEIPGEVPPGYILRHPTTEKVEVGFINLSYVEAGCGIVIFLYCSVCLQLRFWIIQ